MFLPLTVLKEGGNRRYWTWESCCFGIFVPWMVSDVRLGFIVRGRGREHNDMEDGKRGAVETEEKDN